MNEILQKRIEEKSKELAQKYFPNEMNVWARKNLEAQYVESACKEIATFALQNQWISVGEALPKKIEDKNYSKYVLTRQEYYDNEYYVIARYDYGFDMWVSTHYFKPEFITHWMPIPSLEGGER